MKRLVSVMVVCMLVLGSSAVLAANPNALAKAQVIVDQANSEIAAKVDFAVTLSAHLPGPACNAIADWLVRSTNRIADRAIAQCAALGVEVRCSYQTVQIGSKTVLIDPLEVCDE